MPRKCKDSFEECGKEINTTVEEADTPKSGADPQEAAQLEIDRKWDELIR